MIRYFHHKRWKVYFLFCYCSSAAKLTTAQVQAPIFSVSGFVLSNVANILVLMKLYDFCLLLGKFCHINVYVRNFELHTYFSSPCLSYWFCGEPYCACAAISRIDLDYIPGTEKQKLLILDKIKKNWQVQNLFIIMALKVSECGTDMYF
jgi:hypothetical protein